MWKIVPNIVTNWSVVSPFTKHNVDNELLMLWQKMVRHFQRIINWSVVSSFTKHYVDNAVVMLWEK